MTKHYEPLTQNSKTHEPIDWRSPDQIAMRNEEPDDEFIDAGSIKNIPVSALKDLLRFILPRQSDGKTRFSSATARLVILAHLANVDDYGGKSITQLAKSMRVSRACLSWHHVRILDELGLGESRSSKSREARASYRQSATAAHVRAGHQMKRPPLPALNA